MEQFSLDKYLENPNRKITTRYGDREVRIICTDRKAKLPIVALMVNKDDGSEYITLHSINGWSDDEEKYPDKRDLFFADEEELTEFEKCVQNILNEPHFQDVQAVKQFSKTLLDLARKELIEEFSDDNFAIDFAISKGKQDVLETLPKWKKTVQDYYHQGNIPCTNPTISSDEEYLIVGTYEIKISDLETLPKEE